MHFSSWSFWLYFAAWLPYLSCLALYGCRSPWQSSPTGRAQFTLYAALTAVLGLVLVAQLTELPDALRDALRVLVVGGVALAGCYQLTNIIRLQRRDRDCPHPLRRATDHIHNRVDDPDRC